MAGKDKFKRFKKMIDLLSFFISILPYKIQVLLWNLHRNNKGNYGLGIRYCLLKSLAKECGDNIYIASNVVIKNFNNISIGNNVSIHEFCYIDGIGGLVIGNNVSIAHNTSIITFEHTFSNSNEPIKYNPIFLKSIKIEDDVWVACGVRILAGAKIKNRSVVAANTVLLDNEYPSNSLIAGVPGKVKKEI